MSVDTSAATQALAQLEAYASRVSARLGGMVPGGAAMAAPVGARAPVGAPPVPAQGVRGRPVRIQLNRALAPSVLPSGQNLADVSLPLSAAAPSGALGVAVSAQMPGVGQSGALAAYAAAAFPSAARRWARVSDGGKISLGPAMLGAGGVTLNWRRALGPAAGYVAVVLGAARLGEGLSAVASEGARRAAIDGSSVSGQAVAVAAERAGGFIARIGGGLGRILGGGVAGAATAGAAIGSDVFAGGNGRRAALVAEGARDVIEEFVSRATFRAFQTTRVVLEQAQRAAALEAEREARNNAWQTARRLQGLGVDLPERDIYQEIVGPMERRASLLAQAQVAGNKNGEQ